MKKRCSLCEGTGKLGFQREDCCSCFGTGYIEEKTTLDERTCENCTYLSKTASGTIHYPRHCFAQPYPMGVCDIHKYNCMDECCNNEASYIYKNKAMCFDCLISEFNVQEHVTTVYYQDGEYLGSSENCDEVIENLNSDIEIL